jgi:hypothetical protein
MSIQLNLDVQDVNTVIEGLMRVQDNAIRMQNLVRQQATEQLNAQQKAAADAAAKAESDGGGREA